MKILTASIFVLALNIFLFLSQTAVINIGDEVGEPGQLFSNYDVSYLEQFDAGGYTVSENLTNVLPLAEGQIEPTTGNFFTDMFSTFKRFLYSIPGAKYLVGFVNAVPNFLKIIGMPIEVAFSLGALWHAVGIILLIMLLRGHV